MKVALSQQFICGSFILTIDIEDQRPEFTTAIFGEVASLAQASVYVDFIKSLMTADEFTPADGLSEIMTTQEAFDEQTTVKLMLSLDYRKANAKDELQPLLDGFAADLAGKLCRLVDTMLTPRPDFGGFMDALTEIVFTRSERLTPEKIDALATEYHIPNVTIELMQGFGFFADAPAAKRHIPVATMELMDDGYGLPTPPRRAGLFGRIFG